MTSRSLNVGSTTMFSKVKEMSGNKQLILNEIIFSDECHVYIKGMPNKENYWKWALTKPIAFKCICPYYFLKK